MDGEAKQQNETSTALRVTQRDERSFFMSVVHFLVRRMRNKLNKDAPAHEDGSIKLNPPKVKLKMCTLHEHTICDIHVYDYVPPSKSTKECKKRIYYFAGGSWQQPPSGQHYSTLAQLAKDMPDTIISLVSMPLAPNDPAPTAFPWLMRFYRAVMAESQTTGEKIILAGDSSGANIILCLTLEALKEDSEQPQIDIRQVPHPTALMAISPSTDLTRSNPQIKKIAHRDPLLTPEVIKGTARAWHADWDPADRRVSPINNDVSLLKKRGIKVHGVTAGCDVLCPDGILFRDNLAKEGVEGEWVHWENQMHCFLLMQPYGLSEAKESVQWMIDVLKKE